MSTKQAGKAGTKTPKARQKNSGLHVRTPLTLAIESRLLLKGMNHADFAAALNVSGQTVTRWLKRGAPIPEPRVREIIERLEYLPVLEVLRRMIEGQRELNLMLREYPIPEYLNVSVYSVFQNPDVLADARCSYDALRLDAVGAHIAQHLPEFRDAFDWHSPRLISQAELENADSSHAYDLNNSAF